MRTLDSCVGHDWHRLWYSWLAKAVKRKGIRWRLGRTVDVIFDVADLQGSRRCRGYRMLLTLLGCWMLLKLLGVLVLSKEVVLGIDMRGGREPNEALEELVL